MSPNLPVEEQLESLGAALSARPRMTERIMTEVRKSAAMDPVEQRPVIRLADTRCRRRRVLAVTGTMVAICAGLLIAVMLMPSRAIGWADVTTAIQGQNWIHATVNYGEGRQGVMWMSPSRQIWAFALNGSFYFNDGRARIKSEYIQGSESILELPLERDEMQRVLPMDTLSQDKGGIGPWLFGTEKILSQKRREVTEDGKTWIEFDLILWRGEMNQATLRVDPATRLPVFLLATSSKDKSKSYTWQFDYPAEGPTDIYALGAPRDANVVNRVPQEDVLHVLDAMAASRGRIGDFRLLVAQSPGYSDFEVWRNGDRWRVDSRWPSNSVNQNSTPREGQSWNDWIEERLSINQPFPLYICDGDSVWENMSLQPGEEPNWQVSQRTAPQDLLSAEGLGNLPRAANVNFASLLFPDLTPKRGWGFEFDPTPADAPGRLLIKRSARIATAKPMVGHEWYYIDPAKGYAVTRADLFNLPADAPLDPVTNTVWQRIEMEDFEQSPQGFWYAKVIRFTHQLPPGDKDPNKHMQRTIDNAARYRFDFTAPMPDDRFQTDHP